MYANKLAGSRQNQESVIGSLLAELERRGHEPLVHSQRLQELAARTGSAMGLSEKQAQDLGLLIRIHDIGQVIIPDDILNAPRPLSSEKWAVVKRCPDAVYRIARSYGDLTHVADSVLASRERWDGTGYPRGLKEKEIPILARIFQILDAFDAMTHGRPYAPTFSLEEAIGALRRNAGRQFDPELTDVFINKVLKREEAPV
jgi:HD-GYP domain-containing protein (c-di-GMP phosphodiesterase class II)